MSPTSLETENENLKRRKNLGKSPIDTFLLESYIDLKVYCIFFGTWWHVEETSNHWHSDSIFPSVSI